MFIRQVKKQRSKASKIFYQYSLVQAARVDGKVKQRTILYLGSDKELEDKTNRKLVLDTLKSKLFKQPQLMPQDVPAHLEALAQQYYQKYLVKHGQDADFEVSIPTTGEQTEYHNVDITGLNVSDVKSFGAEHLCKQVLEKLQLEECFKDLGMNKAEADKALIAIAARAIFASSEHKTAQLLNMNSELISMYNQESSLSHKQLYRISDKLYQHKDKIDKFLYQRITNWFNLEDKLVIFDISNTYFETSKKNSKLAKYGRSKEKRTDCPLVVFTGVVNPEGFFRHSRIYEGNKADSLTLKDMLCDLENHSTNKLKKTVVIDAGIAKEENLQLIRKKGYHYVCVSRKRLKDYPLDENNTIKQKTNRGNHEVELSIFQPKGQSDTWMYVQSEMKRKKEESMKEKLSKRFEEDLKTIASALDKKRSTKTIEKVWERIGRVKERHKNVSGQYSISVTESDGKATAIQWEYKPNKVKTDKEKGVYFIRTSYQNPSEKELWDVYNTIREVEATFRCLKSDLQIRPVHHQKDERIEAHIYLTMLAYQLVNTIRYMLSQHDIKYDWKNIVRIMSTQTIQTIELPTDKKQIHLRKPAKPIKEVQEIYKATGCTQTQKPIKKYVVYH